MTQIRGRGRAELGPRQCLAPTEQAALVALYREHVVPTAPGDVGGGRGLGARRVRSDHRPDQVKHLQQGPQCRDLVALRGDLHLPQYHPRGVVQSGDRCGATSPAAFAPRTVLPSTAITRRPPSRTTRVRICAPTTASSSSPSVRVNTRRIVASHGRRAPLIPSRASTPDSASATHSPIAVNERAPARTAANATASNGANRCRTPRRARGSVTCSNSSSRPGRSRTPGSTDTVVTGEDDMAGVALRCRCGCENSHPHLKHDARTSPRPACHTTTTLPGPWIRGHYAHMWFRTCVENSGPRRPRKGPE